MTANEMSTTLTEQVLNRVIDTKKQLFTFRIVYFLSTRRHNNILIILKVAKNSQRLLLTCAAVRTPDSAHSATLPVLTDSYCAQC